VNILIVDDEKPARDELRYLLEQERDMTVAAEAENGLEALKALETREIDLVLLDIQMPGMTGLETARQMMALPVFPQIIFVTAWDQFALEAFDVNALDYLLKPLEPERLSRALNRVRNRLLKGAEQEDLEAAVIRILDRTDREKTNTFRKITVYRDGRFVPIGFEEIVLLTADEKHSRIHTLRGVFPYRKNLTELEKLVRDPALFKCHRSYTINLNYIEAVEPWFNNSYRIRMKGVEEPVPVSRSRTADFREILHMD